MENFMEDGVAESGLAEFLTYVEELLKEALDPYKYQIKGKWQANEIHQSVVQAYARAWTLSEFQLTCAEEGKANPYYQDKEIKGVAYHLCQSIDQAIVDYFSEHGEGLLWVPNFNAYGEIVYQKMEQIFKDILYFKNKKVSNHRNFITTL
jgi:hypothetical protein